MQSKNVKVSRFFSSTAQRMFEWMTRTLWRVGTPKWTIRPAHTQALMSAAESRHRRRNPPSAAVPCRQPIRCQPSDLLACCRAPSRHRHSPPRQRPILVARLRSLPQPFVPCRRVVAEGRSHPSANLAFPLLPSLCRQHFVIFTSVAFHRLSAAIVWASLKVLTFNTWRFRLLSACACWCACTRTRY